MKTIFFLFLIPLFGCEVVGATQSKVEPSPFIGRVETTDGSLVGAQENGVWSFKGIPYAQPPVGDLRWREPQPPKTWTGIRSADKFGPRPMQPTLWDDMVFRSQSMSEDCLYLNVWTNASSKAERLPVLVYFHGGALVAGDGSERRYDGADLARKGIVVVTINYRLGIFGFMALPELTAESVHHASGDYGFLDQVAALHWVHENIADFGGDPQHVTIAGQSSGAASVSALMASPLARGLFMGAMGESGSALGGRDVSLHEGEQAGTRFASSVGATSLTALRKMPAETLLKASAPEQFSRGMIVDGYFMPESPNEIYSTGHQAHVPLLAGWNSGEDNFKSILGDAAPTRESYVYALQRLYGNRANEVMKQYPASTPTEVEKAATTLASDRTCGYRVWKWVDVQSETGGRPVFRYLYAQLLPAENAPLDKKGELPMHPPLLGAPHSSEIAYAFGNLGLIDTYAWTSADYKTSHTLQTYFVNFIKTGNPNGNDFPQWPKFEANTSEVMVIRENSAATAEHDSEKYKLVGSLRRK